MAISINIQKNIQNALYTAVGNTDVVVADINTLAQWIQIVAIADTPNSGATLNVQFSAPLVSDYLQLKDENGVNIAIDLNSSNIVKLADISVDSLKFTPSGLTTGGYRVAITTVSEMMNKVN